MPIYEYVCQDCGYHFERLQSFNDAPVAICPDCEGPVRRVISPAGVIFKGSGWYITDSRRQLSDKSAGKSGSRAGESGKAGEAAPKPGAEGGGSGGGGDSGGSGDSGGGADSGGSGAAGGSSDAGAKGGEGGAGKPADKPSPASEA